MESRVPSSWKGAERMKNNISLEEAQDLLLKNCLIKDKENVDLPCALGRVLADNIKAQENIPPFVRSPYDGYALKAEDTTGVTKEAPAQLEVIGEVPAGYFPKEKIEKGKAIKILTGAPVPEGADAVVPYEKTNLEGNRLQVFSPLLPGENVVPEGEDVREGELLAEAGALITPPLTGLLASLGIGKVTVYKRPKIAIVSIGDELLDVSEPLIPGKIHNSNAYTLASYCRELGADPVIIGTASDKVEEAASLIEMGLSRADMVITSGGASVGDYDVTGRSFAAIKTEMLYWKIAIKPGSPTLAGTKDGKVILGLSGNPAAVMVTFQLTATAFIKKMSGRNNYLPHKVDAILKKDFNKASPTRRFLRGKLLFEAGMLFVDASDRQGNGVLRSAVGCNVLAEIPKGSGAIKAGQKLTAYLLD